MNSSSSADHPIRARSAVAWAKVGCGESTIRRQTLTDRKPPRAFGDERTTLVALLHYQRESVVRKTEAVSDDDARRSPVPTGTSLLWLVTHLALAEALWVLERFAGNRSSPT